MFLHETWRNQHTQSTHNRTHKPGGFSPAHPKGAGSAGARGGGSLGITLYLPRRRTQAEGAGRSDID
jgi:hypothetical protein